jgi:hypothetical protein
VCGKEAKDEYVENDLYGKAHFPFTHGGRVDENGDDENVHVGRLPSKRDRPACTHDEQRQQSQQNALVANNKYTSRSQAEGGGSKPCM